MGGSRAMLAGLCLLAAAGCAGIPSEPVVHPFARHVASDGPEGRCARLFLAVDRERERLGVRDAEAAPVPGFPYLRIDRFAAGWKERLRDDSVDYDAWVAYLRRLDLAARAIELSNAGERLDLRRLADASGLPLADWRSVLDEVRRCSEALAALDRRSPAARPVLLGRALVPDSYRYAYRVLGAYPFTSVAFAYGVAEYQRRTRASFATPLARLPVRGGLVRYVPAPSGRSRARDVEGLLERHAPIWEVDVTGPYDRLGALGWNDGRVETHPSDPVVYQYVSHAFLGDHRLTQLNYVAWFGARPKRGVLDLLGGHLDGLTWRVTLDAEGRMLLADAMHNCGCYHMAFPRPGLERRPRDDAWEEPLLVPATLPAFVPARERTVLRVAASTHYLQRVYPAARDARGTGYRRRSYEELRRLPVAGGGTRSAFGPEGLVPGTERAERWLFWPMGVPSAGAMRQRGRHAVAFVGVRHFDDPDLIGRHFLAPRASPE